MTSQTKTNLKRTAKAILAVAIVTSIWKALTSYSGQLDLANVNAKLLTAALGITLAYRLTNACGWSFVLRALHVRLPGWTALRIWITSEACRWLPGSVWSYGSRALQAKKQGVPSVTAGASLVLEMLLTIGAWCVTAVAGLFFYRQSFFELSSNLLREIPVDKVPVGTIGFVCLVGLLITAALFFARHNIERRIASKLDPLKERLNSLRLARPNLRGCAFALAYYVAMCSINGIAAWMVFRAVTPESNVPLLAVIGANAAAWLIGFFAIMAPGGLVVREGAMATLLVAWLPAEQAIAAAIIWRFLQIAVEVACMAGAYAVPYLVGLRESHRASKATQLFNI